MKRNQSSEFDAQAANGTMLRRMLFLMILFGIVAFVVVLVRLYIVQVRDHNHYASLAMEQQMRSTTIAADRGTIYDCCGRVLAVSATAENVYISPAELQEYEEDAEFIAQNLAEILDKDYETILEKAQNTASWYQTIATKVEQETADAVREFITAYHIRSVRLETTTRRYYPYSSLASHIIGFVGTDNYGLSGIESVYDEELTGVDGRTMRTTTSAGTEMLYTNFEEYYDAQDGQSLVLTVDATIQHYLERYLEQAIADYDIQHGAAGIVMDVKTGGILGMASLGDYDLNNYLKVSEEAQTLIDSAPDDTSRTQLLYEAQQAQWRNKALSDTYEPGSTFKIITLAMALEEGAIDRGSSFGCGGSVAVIGRNKPVKCWKTAGHGGQTLTQAVQHSCNVAFVNIGLRVGAETFYEYVENFGFFDRTNIDLQGEGESLWWDDSVFCDETNLSQLAAASFGQTFNITPLQLIRAVCAIANDGWLMQPYVVEKVLDSDGDVVSETKPTAVRQVVSETTSETVCDILEQVVCGAEGTGKNAYVAGYRVAGKTGTSEKVAQDAAGGEKEYIVSFIGFAPADDPQVAVLVLLDTPSNDSGVYISGGQMAAPVVGGILSDVLPYLGVQAQYTEEELKKMDQTVPDLNGLTTAEAEAMLTALGFSVRISGEGETVEQQIPAAGSIVASGSEVILYTEANTASLVEYVPDLYGMRYAEAKARLEKAGMYLHSDDWAIAGEATAVIASQDLAAGSLAPCGSVVTVTLADQSNLGRY